MPPPDKSPGPARRARACTSPGPACCRSSARLPVLQLQDRETCRNKLAIILEFYPAILLSLDQEISAMTHRYPTRFESPRLLFLKPQLDDAPSLFANYASDPRVTKYLLWEPHTEVEGTRDFLQTCLDAWAQETGRREWSLRDKSAMERGVIGMIGCFAKKGSRQASIGYVLAHDCWGRGLMTEALKRLLEILRDMGMFESVEATHHVLNAASGRVMEKAGMRLKGQKMSTHLYAGTSQPVRRYVHTFFSDN